MEITAKFMVASEKGISDQFFLKEAKLKTMYENIVAPGTLNQYITQQLDYSAAVNELNNFNNQMIILYINGEPAGFAVLKQNNLCPEVLKGKKTMHCAHIYILPVYDTDNARLALWQKCLSISARVDAIWMELLQRDPMLPFLESCGFLIQESAAMYPFHQPSYILIRYTNA